MRILVACEESQAVTIELRRLGHEAYSCDIEPCSGGHPEWHIMQDCLPLLNGNCSFLTMDETMHSIDGKWDMIIAFPPCTKTTNAGAKHLYRGHKLNAQRYYAGMCGKALFEAIRHADCDKIAIENPVPSAVFEFPVPSQAIQPYQSHRRRIIYDSSLAVYFSRLLALAWNAYLANCNLPLEQGSDFYQAEGG